MKKILLPALAVSAAWHSILAGVSVVGIVVFLPARRTIGATAYARFARATDLGPGLVVYPVLGIGGFVLSGATFLLALLSGAPRRLSMPLGVAAASAAGVMATTSQAAPTMFAVDRAPDDDAVLMPLLDRFARWSTVRAIFLVLTFWATLLALTLRRPEPA